MKILAKVAYLGTNYHGWQIQPNDLSIQQVIQEKFSLILNTPTEIYASGRTDAGVHAQGQTFHFELNKEFDLNRLMYALNSLLPDDIAIKSLVEVDESFHARFSAKGKHYRYLINNKEKDPFNHLTAMYYPYPLDYERFVKAINLFKGKHNFINFTSKEEDEGGYFRDIYKIEVSKNDDIITVDLYGDGFMRYMIRDIIGTCLAVASCKEDLTYISDRLDNDLSMHTSYRASGEGLCLIDVIY